VVGVGSRGGEWQRGNARCRGLRVSSFYADACGNGTPNSTPHTQLPTPILYDVAPRRCECPDVSLFFRCLPLFLAASAFADAPGVYAIMAARFIRSATGDHERRGDHPRRIDRSVGYAQAIRRRHDHRREGRAHYPGLIDAQTSLDFERDATQRGPRPPARAIRQRRCPRRAVIRRVSRGQAFRRRPEAKRATGSPRSSPRRRSAFSTASRGAEPGGGTMESRVIRNPATQQISFNPRPAWTYPDSLMA